MPDYKSMYFHLAASVADAVELLIKAQQEGESSYVKDNIAQAFTLAVEKDKKKTIDNQD